MRISTDLTENIELLKKEIPIGKSFDLITRDLIIGGRQAYFLGVNGMCDTTVLQRIVAILQKQDGGHNRIEDIRDYIMRKVSFVQAMLCNDTDNLIHNVMCGPVAILVDGFSAAILLDVRRYPTRGMEEPDMEMVSRGARDGFVEMLLTNANSIRRRIRNPRLTFELHKVGSESITDVAICYVEGLAQESVIEETRKKITQMKVSALTMGSKTLEEMLIKKSWFHPLPTIRVTERPDVACSYLQEGYILVLADNSPAVLILPCNIFQFTQNAEDYYKSPVVGNYFRCIRFVCLLLSLFLLPVFYFIVTGYPEVAEKLRLVQSKELSATELFIYILAIEVGLDLFRYASMHSPGRYSGPLSIIGGLIAGDIAIELNWISQEVLFYAAVTLLATLTISNLELAEGIRVYRLFLLFMVGFFGVPGFWIGTGLIFISAVTTPGYGGKSYLWPLYPFCWGALKTLLFRYPAFHAQPDKIWHNPEK